MTGPLYAFTWNLTEVHGWGLVGVHTALYLQEQGRPPVLLAEPMLSNARPAVRAALEPLRITWDRFARLRAANPGKVLRFSDMDVLQSLSNRMVSNTPDLIGRRTLGVIAFEDTTLGPAEKEAGDRYDCLVAHSRYNECLLQDAGFRDVRFAWQGIDPTEMMPLPRSGRFGDRFVVFSGGKLEYRKGQDVVLEAFRRFQARHPDALLVAAWHSPWPGLARGITESPLCQAAPEIDPVTRRLDLNRWVAAHGIPEGAFLDLGFLLRPQIAPLMAEVDAALFPNRCEGATNLVAMEAMACGVPCILSANTGHLDLMEKPGRCLPLTRQIPLPDADGSRRGWCDSDPDEIVAALESLYADRAAARALGAEARAFLMAERTWRGFAETFIAACDR